MVIVDTKDVGLIKSVLCDPEIYERIGNDQAPPADKFEPPIGVKYTYLAGFINDAIIGLWISTPSLDGALIHFQVLKQYREKYATQFAKMALGRVKNSTIYAEIPVCCHDALIFALSLGFKIIGHTGTLRKLEGNRHKVARLRFVDGIC